LAERGLRVLLQSTIAAASKAAHFTTNNRVAEWHDLRQPRQTAGGTEFTCQSCTSGIAFRITTAAPLVAIRQRIAYKLAVITYRTRSTGTPVYLIDLIKNYHPSRTLRSAE